MNAKLTIQPTFAADQPQPVNVRPAPSLADFNRAQLLAIGRAAARFGAMVQSMRRTSQATAPRGEIITAKPAVAAVQPLPPELTD